MTRLGLKKHLKRLPAPAHWPIDRKSTKFTVKPRPGPHRFQQCIPVAILLREVLGHAQTMHDVRRIILSEQLRVDGKIIREPGFPLGVMDVVELVAAGERYRLLPKVGGGFTIIPIDESETKFKLCRVEKKMMVRGSRIQITLHDGRNMLLPLEQKDAIHTLDTVKISVPDQQLISTMPLEIGSFAIVTQGKNIGLHGRVVEIERRYGTHASTATIEGSTGKRIQTALEYIFIVGKTEPEIRLSLEGGLTE